MQNFPLALRRTASGTIGRALRFFFVSIMGVKLWELCGSVGALWEL